MVALPMLLIGLEVINPELYDNEDMASSVKIEKNDNRPMQKNDRV
jgi:hypothetical protein